VLDVQAFAGNGESVVDRAQAFIAYTEGDTEKNPYFIGYWLGTVAGLSAVFRESDYHHRVFYPDDIDAGQLAHIAASFLLQNPDLHNQATNDLVWMSLVQTFGKAPCEGELE